MSAELGTIIDFIRYGASRFGAAGLSFGHSFDNALDESTQLVLHALHLPHDTSPVYGQAQLVAEEKNAVLALFQRRIDERIPACYLTGEAWFAGLSFKCDSRALVPRSPIAELIESGFEPWLGGRPVERMLDLCTGSGCIAIASAHYQPEWQVDGVDRFGPGVIVAPAELPSGRVLYVEAALRRKAVDANASRSVEVVCTLGQGGTNWYYNTYRLNDIRSTDDRSWRHWRYAFYVPAAREGDEMRVYVMQNTNGRVLLKDATVRISAVRK